MRRDEVPPMPDDLPFVVSPDGSRVHDQGLFRWRYDAEGLKTFIEYTPPESRHGDLGIMWKRSWSRPEPGWTHDP